MNARTGRGLRLSWRVGLPHYETDQAFDELMEQVRANRDWLDEVAFFESITHHLYLPMDVLEARAELLGRRVAAMKAAGIASVGINVLTTIGHLNEAWETMAPLPFQPMVGPDGAASTGCACVNTPELRAYVRRKYELMAGARPDFIWIDDDIRMGNHGVPFACFCPLCVEMISSALGERFDRGSLVAALNDPARGDVRAAWVRQNADSITSLLEDVEAAIHGVDPSIATGLMTAGAGDLYSGAPALRWLEALKATKLRPGGGFYSDATPGAMIGKVLDIGRGARDAAAMPEIADIQYELENFPYQKLRKSVTALLSECTLALATGCEGVALNMLPMWGGPFGECEAFLPAIRKVRPEWEAFVAHAAGLPAAGLWPVWHGDVAARCSVQPGQPWLGAHWDRGSAITYCLAEIGLPLSVEPWDGVQPPPWGAVLGGRMAEAVADDELRALLSGGVLMDVEALSVLAERGMSDLAGVRVARQVSNGAMEQFTADPINGAHAGQIRDARIEFWAAKGMGAVLEPVADGVRVLAEMRDYFRRPIGPCLTAFENRLGGRVVVMGYAPWMFLQSVPKRSQLVEMADWVTRGGLPVRVDEVVPLVPFVRMSLDRSKAAVVLLNAGLDPIERADVRIRMAGGERTETVSGLAPWSTSTLLLG